MQVTTLLANALSITAYAVAAPATASDPPELKGLWQGLRDFRCQTGGIDTFSLLTPDVGKCVKFKNKDTAGIKLTFLKENCDFLAYIDDACDELYANMTVAQCFGDDVRTFGSVRLECWE